MTTEIIASSVLGKIVDCLFDAGGRELGYLLHYNDNIETLKTQVKKLADMRVRVQGKIDFAYRRGEIIEVDVRTWVAEVDRITAEAEKFLDDEDKDNKKCLQGWCINLGSCYRFSKEAKQRNEAIDQLQKESNFEKVSREAPPPEIIYSSKGFYVTSNSRELIKKDILEALKNDSVRIIGICGMGGVGKTTLVKEISKKEKEELYDAVVMAVATQNPSIMRIQEEITSQLGLTLSGNNELIRAGSLRQRITKEKRILVVLDDVWGRIELDEIGIPFADDHKDCKVMLTSRIQGVCNEMDAQEVFIVETLSEQESWILFKEVAGQVVDDNIINPIARKVAAECVGLPIAILTLGRALKRSKNMRVWSHAAQQLKNSTPTNIKGMQRNVFSSLELSYNYLESEEAKSLFLFCSFFPEDSYIPVEGLLRYGIGLRWFKEVDTVEDARLRVHSLVSTLTSSFLLISDEDEYIKMHDVVRDFALAIAPKYEHKFMVKAGMGLREWPTRDPFHDLTGI